MPVAPIYQYAVPSLAEAVAGRMPAAGLSWLTRQILRAFRDLLRADRIAAWQRAFDNNRHRNPWHGIESRPGACDTEA